MTMVRPTSRLVLVTVAAVLVTIGVAVALLRQDAAPTGTPQAEAEAFLRQYVDPHGRVIRRDQGGDTVSEGQAYGMLLAEAAGDTGEFDRIWAWTQRHLQLPDGELAYLTNAAGQVQSRQPASDADLLAAWALSRATGPHAAADHAQARRMATAILKNETIARAQMLLLAAGPWATGSPGTLDPSYWAPEAFAGLAKLTGDQEWLRLATWTNASLLSLTHDGAVLPPDWARLDGSTLSPEPAPSGAVPQAEYGLDAQRVVVWLAASCNRSDIHLAARWWRLLSARQRSGAIALSPSGQVLDARTNALPLVAAAAAAGAAGDGSARAALLARAQSVQAAHPTYYGGAWLALGENLIAGSLGRCPSTNVTGGAPA
jgi:endo-1,4-beta-D-glucanase Y